MRWIAPLLLVAGLAVLGLSWESLPEHWPIHWGPGGVPDGWAHKAGVSAFLPFGLGAFIWLMLEGIAIYLDRVGKQHPVLNAGYLAMIRWVGIAIVGATVYTGLALPLLRPSLGLSLAVILGGVGLACGLGFGSILRAAKKSRAAGEVLPEGYGPLAYRNPDDPRLIVPKMYGVGGTFNFAHPLAWVLLGLILIIPAIAIGAVIFASS